MDRLIGRRIAVAKAEIRLQVIGALGVIPARNVPPVEIALCFDAGVAWGRDGTGEVARDAAVRSSGVCARVNLLGFAVGQLNYVHPLARPQLAMGVCAAARILEVVRMCASHGFKASDQSTRGGGIND